MEKAIQLACKGAAWGGPFGAVIFMDGKIVGESTNYVNPHHDPTAHAEIMAIRDACKKLKTTSLKGAVMYSSCEPCPMCKGAIQWAQIDTVFYAAKQNYAQKELGSFKKEDVVFKAIPNPDKNKPFEIAKEYKKAGGVTTNLPITKKKHGKNEKLTNFKNG